MSGRAMGATDFELQVKQVAEQFAQLHQLDFSPASLPLLEERAELKDAEVARAAGAYLAEVVRRRSPVLLRWVEAKRVNSAWNDPLNPFLLCTPKNLVFAVLGKPLRGDGPLREFADRIQDLCSREATGGS